MERFLLANAATKLGSRISYQKFDSGAVYRVNLGHSLLFGNALQACTVQLPLPGPSVPADWFHATRRDVTTQALRDLLAEDESALFGLVSATQPTVMLLPELALGTEDWRDTDGLVRAFDHSLVLLAGGGFVHGKDLIRWESEPTFGPTERLLAIQPEERFSIAHRRCNVGYCWIHLPERGVSTCIAFLKNYPEQRNEAPLIEDLYQASTILRIDASDVTIFPLICADMLNESQDGKAPCERIDFSLNDAQASGGKSIVLGLLFQLDPTNAQWRGKLGNFVSRGEQRVLICNFSSAPPYGPHTNAEIDDKWRNLSGAYSNFNSRANSRSSTGATREVLESSLSLFGQVIRETAACVVGGPLRWGPFDPKKGQAFWDATMVARISMDGRVSPPQIVVRNAKEAARLIRRWIPLWKQRLHDSWLSESSKFAVRLESIGSEEIHSLLEDIVYGPVESTQVVDLDKAETLSQLCSPGERIASSLFLLAVVSSIFDLELESRSGVKGQLTGLPANRNVLVWSDLELTSTKMERAIFDWLDVASSSHPDLIVIAKPIIGDGPEGAMHTHPRRNIGKARPANEYRIDEGARGRRVWSVRLDRLLSACEDDHDGDESSVRRILSFQGDENVS